MSLKILQISPQVPVPPTDGGKISIFGLLKSLSELGHRIDFVCYRKHSDYEFSIQELSKFCNPYIIDVQTDNNLLDAFFNLFSSKPYNISKFIRKEMLEFVNDYFKRNRPNLVHVDHIHMSWVIDHIRELSNIPIVLREHNFESEIMFRMYSNRKDFVSKSYFYLQYKRLLNFEISQAKKFDKVIMISDEDEGKILSYNPNIKTLKIPAGVFDSLFYTQAYKLNKIPYSLFHIGNLDWLPNLDGLEWFVKEVFPLVVEKFPDTKLFIYGKYLEKFQAPYLIEKNIVKVGFVENLWEELKDKLIGIIPLRVGSGIRIKMLELLAQGHFVISTSIGKEGIPLIDGEHLLVADDSLSFAEKIMKVFNGELNYPEICENAQEMIKENYSWKKIASQFEKVYLELLSHNSLGSD